MTVINPSSINSKPIQQAESDIKIEMLQEPPTINKKFRPFRTPGQLVGYYNGSTGSVELFLVSADGDSFLRVT